MSEHKPLDSSADVLPVGLQPTPFGEVWQALQQVAAQVWDVDPSVYRAGIAWMWYALRNPEALDADGLRALLVAALISEQAPMVKDTQTVAELAEYLRLWRDYTPTYAKLEAIFSTFGARVEVRPISDAESQGVVPVDDRRLAFYLRVENFDAARPLTLDEVYQIAVRATPLGSRPVPYYALVGRSDVFAGPASAGVVRALWASEPAVPAPMSFVVVDSSTGAIVHGFNQALDVYELPSVVLNSEDGYETYELPSVALPTPNVVIGVPMSGPVQAFWFTDEGRDEANDKTFTVVGNPLFDGEGSIARNELYDNAVPLSFMQYDGNMFEADSDSDIVRYLPVTDRLVLSIPGDSDTRGKSAWSVQVAKLFVLSYANTQLPDVQIELPINEVGPYGTSITLPTIDGEYESGGKTWKPSAWDIGAFGSSYSLTADTVAHLVFEEVQQYQEITLYLASGNKQAQTGVTSSYTGNVNSSYCYQLYTDEQFTMPWTGYDYSNDYEVGYIQSSGAWTEFIDSVAEMPDYVGSGIDFKVGRILLDTGYLWLCCNLPSSSTATASTSKIVVRIYPKAQQHYPAYLNYNNTYSNTTITAGTLIRGLYPYPYGGTSSNYKAWYATFPKPTLTRILKSDGKELPQTQGDSVAASGGWYLSYSHSTSQSFRLVEFTLNRPTLFAWLKADHTDQSTASNTAYPLYDESGNVILYDSLAIYVPIGLFVSTKTNCDGELNVVQRSTIINNSGTLAFNQGYGIVSIARVWYVKYTDYKVAYFNADKSNYTLSLNTRRSLYDAYGDRIAFDDTKIYTFLQLRNTSDVQSIVRFVNRDSMSFVSSSGNLAFQNYSDTSYTVASVWYLEE